MNVYFQLCGDLDKTMIIYAPCIYCWSTEGNWLKAETLEPLPDPTRDQVIHQPDFF